ncbi:hypothetical protein [Parasitella parasitica]|uniref:Chromo domain-containing protein n=1 Tax=Parasitella parasitica TaxID=35722 RepID=A0A0B7NH75_9FUNG|nr:hypothetical protein [Parasitella parasitica]
MDLFSRFIVLRAFPNKAAPTVAKEIVSIFSLFGYPAIISHDNGNEFSSQLLESIAANAQIEQCLSLPYTPYGNSACEAAVKSAKAIIIKMLDGCAENWDLYLDGTAGEAPNHEYLVRWKGFDASWDTWEIASNFDSKEPIKLYWSRQGATNNDSSNKRKRAPKSVNKRKVATREERSTKRFARLINKRRPTDTTTP